jgi:carbamate kinase
MRTVVALGGNAVVGQDDVSVARQRKRIRTATDPVRTLTDRGHEVVLTHGNGPQVGRSLERQEEASLPERPLAVLVAETQAQIGYLLADELDPLDEDRVSTVLTRVRVEPDDPAFSNPSKPVGPYYDEAAAAAKPFETMAVTTPEGDDAYRRVVPSPRPIEVLERDEIGTLVDSGSTVVCGGGGGVPVVGDDRSVPDTAMSLSADEATSASGVAAVVDKDHTTSLIASSVDADLLVMATDVEYAYRDFGTADQRPIRQADTSTMRSALANGEFAVGSMRPKVEACLDFLRNGGDRVVITTPEQIVAAVDGDAGTQIRP